MSARGVKGGEPARRAAPQRTPRAARTRRRSNASPAAAAEILARLRKTYPDARCSLDYRTPFELLIATILSAQCTDVRVNMVTPSLFKRYPTIRALAEARREDVEEIIRSTGFFRNKTKSIIGMANAVLDRHGSAVPDTMEHLTSLPGVGRKTANVLLGNAFGKNEGVVVDTHVARVSQRLGLTRQLIPVKIEAALQKLFPREHWTLLSHLLIYHGRAVCEARAPKCAVCVLNDICPSSRV